MAKGNPWPFATVFDLAPLNGGCIFVEISAFPFNRYLAERGHFTPHQLPLCMTPAAWHKRSQPQPLPRLTTLRTTVHCTPSGLSQRRSERAYKEGCINTARLSSNRSTPFSSTLQPTPNREAERKENGPTSSSGNGTVSPPLNI